LSFHIGFYFWVRAVLLVIPAGGLFLFSISFMLLLISSIVKITTEPIRCDAYNIAMDYWQLLDKEAPPLFRFDEMQMLYAMVKKGGMISRAKTYIEYNYEWQGGEWFLNASGYFDTICRKYKIYPAWLTLN
jgi:hypothetical protein